MSKEVKPQTADKTPHSSTKKGISRAREITGGKSLSGIVIRVLLVVAAIGIGGYLLYYKVVQGDAVFVISNREINPESDTDSVTSYKVQDKVYFHLHRKYSTMDSGMVTFIIRREEGGKLQDYKKIQYEVEKDFPSLDSVVPGTYFRKAGKYQIEIQFDGNVSAHTDFVVK